MDEALSWLWQLFHTPWFCQTAKCGLAVVISLALFFVLDAGREQR